MGLPHLFEQVVLRVVEDVVGVRLWDAWVVLAEWGLDGDLVGELDAVAFAAGLEDDDFQGGGCLLEGLHGDAEDRGVDGFCGLGRLGGLKGEGR